MDKGILLIIALFLAISFPLTARGEGETEMRADGGVTLKAYILQDDMVSVLEVYEKFRTFYPNIEIEFLNKDYFAGEKIIVQLAGGADIDIFPTDNNSVYSDYVSKGVADNLDEFIKRDKLDVSAYGSIWNGMKIDGSIYALPVRKSIWTLFYNKDLFDKAGEPYPSDMTWSEFRALARRMTSGSGNDKIWGTYIHTWPICTFGPALQTGKTIIDEDLSAVKDALQLRLNLQNDGSIMPYGDQVALKAHYRSMFLGGRIAMHPIGDWHIGQLREEGENVGFSWDIAPMPYPEGMDGNVTWGMPSGMAINSSSAKKEAAWEFLKFLSGIEGQKILAKNGFTPVYTNDETKSIYLGEEEGRIPENLEILLNQKVYVEYPPFEGVNYIVTTIYKEEIGLVLINEQSPEEAVQKIKERIREEL